MQRLIIFIATMLSLVGCGPEYQVRASVKGPFVRVSFSGLEPGDIVSVGSRKVVNDDKEDYFQTIYLGAETLGGGKQRLVAEVDRKGSKGQKTIDLDVPAKALEPWIEVHGCIEEGYEPTGLDWVKERKPGEQPTTFIDLRIESEIFLDFSATGSKFKKAESNCEAHRDATVHFAVHANFDAEVSIDDQPVALKEGVGVHLLDLRNLLHELPLHERQEWHKKTSPRKTLEMVVKRGGKTKKHTLELKIHKLTLIWHMLEDQVKKAELGKPASWIRSASKSSKRGVFFRADAFEVTEKGMKRPVRLRKYSSPIPIGPKDLRADEVDLLALAKPIDVKREGPCSGYRNISGDASVTNVLYTHGFEVTVQNATGKKLATKTFDRPKKGKCPSTFSGKSGDHVVLVHGPSFRKMEKWIESVRTKN